MKSIISGKSYLSYIFPEHKHTTWEIIANISGKGYMSYCGKKIPFDDKTIVCIPPNVEHAKISDEGFVDLWIWADDIPSLNLTEPTIVNDDGEKSLFSLINMLYTIQCRRDSGSKLVTEMLFETICQMILYHLNKKSYDKRVDAIINVIIQNFQKIDFSIDSCLDKSGYSADYMRRLFRKDTGKSPNEYLTEMRLRTAKSLLSSRKFSNYSITEISSMVGYKDISYFSRIFKEKTGMTPLEYCKDKDI